MKTLLTMLALLWASTSWAASITFDSFQTGEGTTGATYDNTIAADANIAVVCVAVRDSGGAVANVTSVEIETVPATHLTRISSGGVMQAELWYLLSPPTGENVTTVVASDATTEFTVAGTLTFKGVAQTDTWNTPDSATSSGGSTTLYVDGIPSAVGEMAVLCPAIRTETTTATPEGTAPVSTEVYENPHATVGSMVGAAYYEAGDTTSINMRVTLAPSVQWAAVAASMRPLVSTRRPHSPIYLGQ